MYAKPRFLPGGDSALCMEFGNAISPEIGKKVRAVSLAIQNARIAGIVEIVPTYRSFLVHFNPFVIAPDELRARVESFDLQAGDLKLPEPVVMEIPVLYGGEFGPDLDYVARCHSLTPEEVVRIHTGTIYPIYMIGFMPGFSYLGGLSEKIATPRLATPRTKVPAGSVGLAGTQTGIYPADSPGGWQLIGRTPVKLFDPRREPPSFLKAGDYIKFFSVSVAEYDRIKEEVEQGVYRLRETILKEQK